MDCCNMAVSGDGSTYFCVCIQSVVRGVHVYKAVWTSVGVKKFSINFWDISLTAKLQKPRGLQLIKRQEKLIEEGDGAQV